MTTRTEPWPAGTPCWVDYGATDVEAATGFYTEVLGWAATASGPEHGGYVMCAVRGHDAAGIGPAAEGAPPAWTTYLASADADATAARVRAAGGTVLAEPFDVGDLGRMLVAADPQGAVVGVWQAGRHVGCGVVNEPGALTWNEASLPDPAAGRAFYSEVFGYRWEAVPGGGVDYWTFAGDEGRPLGGLGGLSGDGSPPHWLAYFSVADSDAVVATAKGLGAEVAAGPFDTEYGRMATVVDPWGARFAVMGGGSAA
ncbi:VOC family protein [Aquipuribacter sp. SD81]|uniref:VOC family protein n=1 Tax=Aquipuribacter sp. SD81 TaxID=3127703 RepID=UPI003019B71B